ncbi:MAG: hypothetical protein PHC88_10390 [Terrimicrobiaceae bacterium]|nr:hypothetical protein [Terrimicrobiaceae bacterium]
MKTKMHAWLSLVCPLVALLAAHSALGVEKPPSKISEFAGNFSGTALLVQSPAPTASGTTQATFTAVKKKENGTLTLNSIFNSGGSSIPVQERYTFRGKSMTYVLTASGTSVVGFGRANIAKKIIKYSAVVTSSGTSITILGTIRRTKKTLLVTEQLASSSLSAVFTYHLNRRGK